MALFGEKYGDEVRVVSMAGDDEHGAHFSTELCGGTHVKRTGDIGFLKITSEGAVGSGVRRIEAVTGAGALDYVRQHDMILASAADALRASPADLTERIASLIEDRKRLEREVSDLRKKIAMGGAASTGSAAREVGGIPFSGRVLQDVPAKELKGMVDEMKAQLGSAVVALVAVTDGKASLVVGVTDDLKGKVSAVDLVRAGSAAVGGKGGGGRPDMAQAGGPDGSKADAALEAIEAALGEMVAA